MNSFQNKLLTYFIILFLVQSCIDCKRKSSSSKKQRVSNETLVTELKSIDFENYNTTHKAYFLYFYESLCKNCEEVSYSFDVASLVTKTPEFAHVSFAKINSENNENITNVFNVKTHP